MCVAPLRLFAGNTMEDIVRDLKADGSEFASKQVEVRTSSTCRWRSSKSSQTISSILQGALEHRRVCPPDIDGDQSGGFQHRSGFVVV